LEQLRYDPARKITDQGDLNLMSDHHVRWGNRHATRQLPHKLREAMPLLRIVPFPDLSVMSIRERETGASRCLGLAKGLKHTRYFRRTLEAIGCQRECNETYIITLSISEIIKKDLYFY
jgi:hypothetical protein